MIINYVPNQPKRKDFTKHSMSKLIIQTIIINNNGRPKRKSGHRIWQRGAPIVTEPNIRTKESKRLERWNNYANIQYKGDPKVYNLIIEVLLLGMQQIKYTQEF